MQKAQPHSEIGPSCLMDVTRGSPFISYMIWYILSNKIGEELCLHTREVRVKK